MDVAILGKPLRSLRLLGCSISLALLAAAPAVASAAPIALGVNADNAPGQLAPLTTYSALAGRAPALVMWYQQWSEPLYYSSQLPNVSAVGAAPVITWDPTLNGIGIPLADIAAGRYDTYIKQAAQAAVAARRPIYIRFAHEMNLSGAPFGPGHPGDTAATFVAAWRHVVTVFRQQGATNVEWVFSPNVDCSGRCPFTAFYPGDAWVDWVALDGYNYSTVDNVPWMTFDQIFGPSYAELTRLTSKPVMIGETSSAALGGNKAQWITQTLGELPARYPQVHALIWFDRVKETDWRVNSSASALAAWRAMATSAAYSGSAATLLALAPLANDATVRSAFVHSRLHRHRHRHKHRRKHKRRHRRRHH